MDSRQDDEQKKELAIAMLIIDRPLSVHVSTYLEDASRNSADVLEQIPKCC